MKKLLIFLFLFLAGCNSKDPITEYRWAVVHPSEALYQCPAIKHFPSWKILTEKQVVSTILTLQKNNLTCRSNMNQIKEFLKKSEIELNTKNNK